MIEGHDDVKRDLRKNQKNYIHLQANVFARDRVSIIDMSPVLSAAARERQVTLTLSEFHLNLAGLETIFRRLIETNE